MFVFIAFLTLSTLYGLKTMRQCWIPQDEGVLAQMAERTLQGEFPHRDFDESYSGALTGLNALAFRLIGVRLVALRIPLLIFYIVFLAAMYAAVRRWLSPIGAMLFGLACLPWGPPAYFGPLPSWYLSFFAGAGTYGLLRFAESGRRRFLLLAGAAGGMAICFKILGIYFVLAGLIFLSYHDTVRGDHRLSGGGTFVSSFLHRALKGLISLIGVGVLFAVLWPRLGVREAILFLLPGVLMAMTPVILEWRKRGAASAKQLKDFASTVAWFGSGIALPLAVFLVVFQRAHALPQLINDVFVLPMRRYDYAYYALPSVLTYLSVLPLGIFLWRASVPGLERRTISWQWPTAGVLLALALSGGHPVAYQLVWHTLRPTIPLICGLTTCRLLKGTSLSRLQQEQLFVVVAAAAFVSVVQFPDSFGIYFFYIMPFAALATVAYFQSFRQRFQLTGGAWLMAYAVFGYLWIARADPGGAGESFARRDIAATLLPERADLRVPAEQAELYARLVREIELRSAGSEYIFAGPDCPQVYFLSKKKNPTRFFYEFFNPKEAGDAAILESIQAHHVRVVVLNSAPGFSHPVTRAFYQAVHKEFPHDEDIGGFRLFW